MPWSVLGLAACNLGDRVDPDAMQPHGSERKPWEKLENETIPRFMYQLSLLKGVRESQINAAKNYRAVILTTIVSLSASLGQVAAKYAMMKFDLHRDADEGCG